MKLSDYRTPGHCRAQQPERRHISLSDPMSLASHGLLLRPYDDPLLWTFAWDMPGSSRMMKLMPFLAQGFSVLFGVSKAYLVLLIIDADCMPVDDMPSPLKALSTR